jgi:hypothetical protein
MTTPITTPTSNGFSVADAQDLTSNIITLMGMSFILGVLITTFLLLVLDFMRRHAEEEE